MTEEPLLYGWKAIHKWFKERGIPVSIRTLRDRWAKRKAMPVHRSDLRREVVADPDALEGWVQRYILDQPEDPE